MLADSRISHCQSANQTDPISQSRAEESRISRAGFIAIKITGTLIFWEYSLKKLFLFYVLKEELHQPHATKLTVLANNERKKKNKWKEKIPEYVQSKEQREKIDND